MDVLTANAAVTRFSLCHHALMRRCFVVLVALLAAVAGFVAPPASAEGTPIGNLGDTLRVEFKGIIADVTVHDVIPTDAPPGYRATGSPRWVNEGGPWKALVTIHTIQAPNPYAMAIAFAFDGVTPYADAYTPKNTDAPDALQYAPSERPAGGDGQRRRVLAGLPRPRDERGAGTTRPQASTWRSGTSGSREHRYRRAVAIDVAAAVEADLPELADVAARTFPLACPPSVTPENIAAFVDENLSQARFRDYLADPDRAVLAARDEGRIVGYVMLIRGVPDDDDVQRAVTCAPPSSCPRCTCCPTATAQASPRR